MKIVIKVKRGRPKKKQVESFKILQVKDGKYMDNTPIDAGAVGTFAAVPEPPGSKVTNVPVWTSSDVTIATVETPNSDASGLTTKVTGIAAGSITLTVASTRPDGNVAQGQIVVTIAPGEVQSFTVSRTA